MQNYHVSKTAETEFIVTATIIVVITTLFFCLLVLTNNYITWITNTTII